MTKAQELVEDLVVARGLCGLQRYHRLVSYPGCIRSGYNNNNKNTIIVTILIMVTVIVQL